MSTFFCDERIGEVSLHFERKVVERFLENYIKGLRSFRLERRGVDERTNRPLFAVFSMQSGSRYDIRNWSCTCN